MYMKRGENAGTEDAFDHDRPPPNRYLSGTDSSDLQHEKYIALAH